MPRAFSESKPQYSKIRAPFGVREIAAPASFLKEERSKTCECGSLATGMSIETNVSDIKSTID